MEQCSRVLTINILRSRNLINIHNECSTTGAMRTKDSFQVLKCPLLRGVTVL